MTLGEDRFLRIEKIPRHHGVYDPLKSEPYELSRSRIENFVKCPACFYLELLKANGLESLIPLEDDRFERWTNSPQFGLEGYFNTVHEETNLKVGGGLDDVWLNTETGQVHLVDYKSTSQKSPGKEMTLDDWWKASYKRQMDFYIWVMRRLDLNTSDTGYFLYCDGDRFTNVNSLHYDGATMHFRMTLLAYESDLSWIEPTLRQIKELLHAEECPNHADQCEHGKFITACSKVNQ